MQQVNESILGMLYMRSMKVPLLCCATNLRQVKLNRIMSSVFVVDKSQAEASEK